MSRFLTSSGFVIAALMALTPTAHAGVALGAPLGAVLPFDAGGLLGIVAAAVVGAIYVTRRKR